MPPCCALLPTPSNMLHVFTLLTGLPVVPSYFFLTYASFFITSLKAYSYLFCSFCSFGNSHQDVFIGFAPSHPGHGDRQPWMDTFACLWWWLPGGCCCHFSESVHSSCRMSWRILSPVTTAVTAPQARLIWLCVLCSEPRLLPLCLRTRNVYHSVGVTHVL